MAQQQIYGAVSLKILAALLILIYLTGCSLVSKPEPEIQVVTKLEKTTVPTVARPKPVQLIDTKVYVVNQENLEDFILEFTEVHGDLAFVALSMRDYENLALNIAELRRYINQQTNIIIYYEEAVSPDPNADDVPVSETKLQ